MSITGLLIYLKLLNDRVEAKVRTFYTATIVIAVIFVFSAICFAGTLARVAYWSKLSDSIGSEDSKWNTVLIIAEFVVLVFIFCNLLNIVTKGKWFTQLGQVKDFVLGIRSVNHTKNRTFDSLHATRKRILFASTRLSALVYLQSKQCD